MADPLLSVPGLGGWLSQRDRNMGESRENLAQVGRMRTMQSQFQAEALQRQAREEFTAMGPNPRPEQLIQWAAKYSPPKDVLNQVQHAETSRNQQAATNEASTARLQQAASQFEQTYRLAREKAKDAREQHSIDNVFKARKSYLDQEAARIGGARLFWETGQGGFGTPALPEVPQAGGEEVTFSRGLPSGEVVRGTAPNEEAAIAAVRGGEAAPQRSFQPPPPALPPQDRFVTDWMTPEQLSLPPKDRAKLIADQEGAKASGVFATDTSMYKDLLASYDRLEEQVKLVKRAKLGRITGITGMVPNIPGMAGATAESRLTGLKNKVMIDTMRSLKAISPTGATGFGSLTEAEGARLEGYLGNLSTATDDTELKRVLDDIEDFSRKAKARLTEAYKQKHRTRIGAPGARGAASREAILREADAIVGGR